MVNFDAIELNVFTLQMIVLQIGARLDRDTHKYFLDGVEMSSSVTKRIDDHITQKHFNGPLMSQNVFRLCEKIRRFPQAKYKAKQLAQFERHGKYKSAKEIEDAWKANQVRGTEMHATIEEYLLGQCLPGDSRLQTAEMGIFLSFHKWLVKSYEIVALEAVVIDPRLDTGGSVDCVCRRRDDPDPNNLVFFDWKKMAAEVMEFDEDKHMCKFFNLPVCKRAKHEVQLNMYAEMTERMTKYKVVGLYIVPIDVELGLDILPVERRKTETAAYFSSLQHALENKLMTLAEDIKPIRGALMSTNKRKKPR